MNTMDRGQLSRRGALKFAAGLAAATAAVGQTTAISSAHDLRPTDSAYAFDDYERIVSRDVTMRMLYEWPNVTNPIIFNNLSNGLNGFQFSYDLPSNQIQVVVQAYATANLAMYDDVVWANYRLGEVFKVLDPTTGEPAIRNIWFASKIRPADQPPEDRTNPYYSDLSIEGLQRRGVLFLICHQTVHAHAGAVAASEQNTDHLSADQVLADIQAHLIPGGLLVPAAVGELVRLQDKGYRMVVNA